MNPKPYTIGTDSAGESFTVTDYYEGGKHVGRLIRDSGGNKVDSWFSGETEWSWYAASYEAADDWLKEKSLKK
jgi:hypothetical protein